MLAVPVRRSGRVLGVLAVQNRTPRHFTGQEVDELETVAMLLAEMLPAAGAEDGAGEGVCRAPCRGVFAGTDADDRHRHRAGGAARHAHGAAPAAGRRPGAELARLNDAVDAHAARDRRSARGRRADRDADAGVARRAGSLSAGRRRSRLAAPGRRRHQRRPDRRGRRAPRRHRAARPHAPDQRSLSARAAGRSGGSRQPAADRTDGRPAARSRCRRAPSCWRAGWARRSCWTGTPTASPASRSRKPARPATPRSWRALWASRRSAAPAACWTPPSRRTRRCSTATARNWCCGPRRRCARSIVRALEARIAAPRRVRGAARPAVGRPRDGMPVSLMLNVGLDLELAQLDGPAPTGSACSAPRSPCWRAAPSPTWPSRRRSMPACWMRRATGRCCSARSISAPTSCCRAPAPRRKIRRWAGARCASGWIGRRCCAGSCARCCWRPAGGRLSVMFPMVATVAEFRAARALLLAEATRVRPAPERLSIGTMLEVPALMWQLPDLLREADFISVGSNDLVQFMFAADRGTPSLSDRYDVLSPPMLDLLEQAGRARRARPACRCRCAARRRRGRWRRWRSSASA